MLPRACWFLLTAAFPTLIHGQPTPADWPDTVHLVSQHRREGLPLRDDPDRRPERRRRTRCPVRAEPLRPAHDHRASPPPRLPAKSSGRPAHPRTTTAGPTAISRCRSTTGTVTDATKCSTSARPTYLDSPPPAARTIRERAPPLRRRRHHGRAGRPHGPGERPASACPRRPTTAFCLPT